LTLVHITLTEPPSAVTTAMMAPANAGGDQGIFDRGGAFLCGQEAADLVGCDQTAHSAVPTRV